MPLTKSSWVPSVFLRSAQRVSALTNRATKITANLKCRISDLRNHHDIARSQKNVLLWLLTPDYGFIVKLAYNVFASVIPDNGHFRLFGVLLETTRQRRCLQNSDRFFYYQSARALRPADDINSVTLNSLDNDGDVG